MNKRLISGIIFCSLLFSLAAWAGEIAPPEKNIILIGWDGAQRDHVKECLKRGELPNLKKLADEGTMVGIDITRITDTKSGWTQILTGYQPEITGVFNNSKYQPIPAGYTVFERLEKHFGKDNIATIAVIGKKAHVDASGPQRIRVRESAEDERRAPAKNRRRAGLRQAGNRRKPAAAAPKKAKKPEGKIVVENGISWRVIPGKPYYHTKEGMDLFLNGLTTNDNVGAKTIELLAKYKNKPFFFFVHFAEVDHDGHRFGENSKEYNDALISCDKWLGKITASLKEMGLYEKTLIYVTADHGFDEGEKGHHDAPYVFLTTNDKGVMRRGLREDITPTILDRYGLDLSKIEPPLDGHPLTKPYAHPLW